ncbi:hypothetical protein ACQFX9_15095 [Aliinostoc sp. HNIBRCY26]|uniref:hypothetical protein n=1 Tax=Aliinostoc sp. HNIBRCY26 TaxID=3418997 RepID=UPI003CFD6384
MNTRSQKLFGAICGGMLMSISLVPQSASAQQSIPKVNPCPSIFYEEPHNNRVIVPQGCPPNALTRRLEAQGLLPPVTSPTTQSSYPQGVGGEAPQARTPGLNPCPRIYYEEPFNSRNVVPQGCPPNALTQQLQSQGITPEQAAIPRPDVSVTQPPLPSQQQQPSARLALVNNQVNVRLINETGAEVTYEVIGDTPPRSLQGKSDVMLQGLNAPVTVTLYRNDGGLLQVTPQPTSTPGMLEVRLGATTNFGQDKNTVRIQENGSVYLN